MDGMFDYFYNRQADAFNFIRVPQVLLEDEIFRKLSSDAKLLYSIMLQRAGLSYKNDWFDAKGRIFIYFTIEEVMTTFNNSSKTAVKIFSELENIGLIERKRQGIGRPSIIYVKDFMSTFSDCKTYKLRVGESTNETCKKYNSRIVETTSQDLEKVQPSYIENNKIDMNKSDFRKAKAAYGTYRNVFLAEDEYSELKSQIGYLDDLIERLSNYMKSSGKAYEDHRATLMTWFIKEKPKTKAMSKEEYYKTDLGL